MLEALDSKLLALEARELVREEAFAAGACVREETFAAGACVSEEAFAEREAKAADCLERREDSMALARREEGLVFLVGMGGVLERWEGGGGWGGAGRWISEGKRGKRVQRGDGGGKGKW